MGNTEFTSHLGQDQLESLSSEKLDLSRRLTSEQLEKHLRGDGDEDSPALTEIPAKIFAQVSFYEKLIVAFHCISRIPSELPMQLPHLVQLNLNYNRITSLPESFGLLVHLEILELSHNVLTTLPSSFCLLKSLKKLDLSNNQLQSLRDDIGKLKRLRKLNVANNRLGTIPRSLCLNDRLEVVVAFHNKLSNPPQCICDKGLACIREYYIKQDQHLSIPTHKGDISVFPRVKKLDQLSHPNLNTAMRQYSQMQTESFNIKTKVQMPLLPPPTATSLLPDELSDRIIGCIYGSAIGNTIGLCTVFMNKNECNFHYEKENITYEHMIQDVRRINLRKGCWSSAFDQMVLLLESVLSWGGVVDELDFARKLQIWNTNGITELEDSKGAHIKGVLGKVLEHQDFVTDPHFVAKMISRENEFHSNEAIIRTAILAIPQFHNLDEVTANAVRICKATHADPRCIASCVAVSTIIALLLQGKYVDNDVKSLNVILAEARSKATQQLAEEAHIDELKRYMECENFESVGCNETNNINHTFKPLGGAVVALKVDKESFKSTITELLFEGGHSSYNAMVAGAVLGSKIGFKMLPTEWLEPLCIKRRNWLNNKINCLLNMMGLP